MTGSNRARGEVRVREKYVRAEYTGVRKECARGSSTREERVCSMEEYTRGMRQVEKRC